MAMFTFLASVSGPRSKMEEMREIADRLLDLARGAIGIERDGVGGRDAEIQIGTTDYVLKESV